MRRVLLLLPLLALAGCKKDELPQGAVKVTVSYSGFLPGCVSVRARDPDSGGELSGTLPGKGPRTGGSLTVAILAPEGWSTVEVEARAFERECTGEPVAHRSESVVLTRGETRQVTLQMVAPDADQDGYVARRSGGTDCNDNAASVHPNADELCNDVDDNCNGQQDSAELRLGQPCTEGASCEGTRVCGADGKAVCDTPAAKLAYPDVDGDGHGDKNATATAYCGARPAGYVQDSHDDCNDSRTDVYAGALERCDGADNDCDGPADEDFPQLSAACTDAATQCGGTYQCNPGGSGVACTPTTAPPTWYPDEDGDGFGRSGAAVTSCVQPAATITQGGDCDDGNPFTHSGATELCDTLDNDCDGQPEDPALRCPAGGPIWAERTVGASNQEWRSVFTSTPGSVGIVGGADARATLTVGSNTFQTTTTGCTVSGGNTGWNTVWIDEASNARTYFGSTGGRLVYQDRSSSTCSEQRDIDLAVRGLVGLRNGGTLELHGVTSESGTLGEGTTFIWNGGGTLTFGTTPVAPLHDVHGVSRSALFAVGGYDASGLSSAEPRIYQFNATSGQWETEGVQSLNGLSRLNGVWVVNEKLAFAVGNGNSVLKWNGAGWSKLAFPNNFTESLTSVVAFGPSLAYATAYNGRIYRYDGQQWTQIFQDTSLKFLDIAGTSPEDLWVVGENGLVLHWPQWPQ